MNKTDKAAKEQIKFCLCFKSAKPTGRSPNCSVTFPPDSVYCYIHQHKLREKTTVTPAPKRGRLPFPPRNRQNRPLPHNRPFAIRPKIQSPPQREFRFGNGRDGLFRSINRGKRSRGSPPVWIYPSKRLLLVAISRLYLR